MGSLPISFHGTGVQRAPFRGPTFLVKVKINFFMHLD